MATNMKSLNGYGFDASALGGHDPSYYATSEDIQQVRNEIPTELPNPNALTFTGAVSETYDGSAPKSVAIPTVPESLKNPYKLKLSGAVTAEYDGSAEVSVEFPAGGGSGYELPIASATQLGGVMPVAKTDEMTQAVGVDEAGGLWALPGGGSIDSFELIGTVDFSTEEMGAWGAAMTFDVDNVQEIVLIWRGMVNGNSSNSSIYVSLIGDDGTAFNCMSGILTSKSGSTLNGWSYNRLLPGFGVIGFRSPGSSAVIGNDSNATIPYNTDKSTDASFIKAIKVQNATTSYYAVGGTVKVYAR